MKSAYRTVVAFFIVVVLQTTIRASFGQLPSEFSRVAKCEIVDSLINQDSNAPWELIAKRKVTDGGLFHVFFSDEKTGWVAGPEVLYQTRDAGLTWHRNTLRIPKNFMVTKILFINNQHGWVTLGRPSYDPNKKELWLMHTDDAGETWSRLLKLSKVFGEDLMFVDQRNGWLAANSYFDSTRYRPMVRHSSDEGKTWVDVTGGLLKAFPASAIRYGSSLSHIVGQSDLIATVSTFEGETFKTMDGGKTWSRFLTPCPAELPTTHGMYFGISGSNHLWMADGADSLEGIQGEIFNQQSDGSWTHHWLPYFALADATFVSERDVFAAGSLIDRTSGLRQAALLYSSDGAFNWFIVHGDDQATRFSAMAAVGSDHVYAVATNGLFVSYQRKLLR